MHAGKVALRAVVLTTHLVWVQAASAQGAANLDNATCLGCHGVPGFAAPRADGRRARCSWRRINLPTACTARRCAASIATRRSPSCRTRPCRRQPAEWDRTRLAITKNCIACHAKAAQGYTETYHGQVVVMGFATWRDLRRLPRQPRHSARQQSGLERGAGQSAEDLPKCHVDATPGFATFQPHATTDDFAHYPYTWLASKFVNLAVGGVLLFFWIHSALWFYREYRDRQQQKPRPHVRSRRGAARRKPLLSALERDVALGAPAVRGQHHPAGRDRHHLALSEHGLGAGARTRHGRTGNRRHHPPGCRRGHGRGLCLAHCLCRHPHRAELVELQSIRALFADAELAGRRRLRRHVQMVFRPAAAAVIRPLELSAEGRLLGAVLGHRHAGRDRRRAVVQDAHRGLSAGLGVQCRDRRARRRSACSPPPTCSRCIISSITGGRTNSRSTSSCSPARCRSTSSSANTPSNTPGWRQSGQLQQHLVDAPSRPLTLGAKILGFCLVAVGLALLVMMAIGFGGNHF